ncbi:MAG: AAA family ATPase [Pseudanabaenaceae cyanobacterium]
MNIGICGAHRTGKTSLAQGLAVALGIPFVRTSTSQVFQTWGLDPAQPLDFPTRLFIQNQVLNSAETIWQIAHQTTSQFITDRTPIDMMAYTLGDIQGSTVVEEQALFAYLDRCWQLTNQFFGQLCIIPPAIPLVFESGKAALNPAYIQHIHWLILGLCHDPRLRAQVILLPKHIVALPDRIKFVQEQLDCHFPPRAG